MKEDWNTSNRSNRQKQRRKPKHLARNVFIGSFFISFCYVALLAVSLITNNLSQSADNGQPSMPLPSSVVIATDYNSTPTDDAQDNNNEPDPVDDAAWHLILVNRWNPIPDEYEVELTELANGQQVDKRIYPALQDMFDAARSDGAYPVVVSGYRTADTQQRLLDEKIAEYRAAGCSATEARTQAEAWVAIPGTSEHQIGIAVDINADGVRSAGYEVYAWLEQNAHKYGFICRYPPDKTEITGVIGEAWHYRYVGVEAATEIYNQGICLEEYLNSTN